MKQSLKRKLAILLSLSMCISIMTPDTLLARDVVTDLNGEESVSQSTISEQTVSEETLAETEMEESFTGSSTECIASSDMDYSTVGNKIIVSYNIVLQDGYRFFNTGIKTYDNIEGKWCYRSGYIPGAQSAGDTSVSLTGICAAGYGNKKVVLFANIYKEGDASTNYSEVSVIEKEITIKDAETKDKYIYISYGGGKNERLGNDIKYEAGEYIPVTITSIKDTGITFSPNTGVLTLKNVGEYPVELSSVSGYDKLKVVIEDSAPIGLGAPDTIIELEGNSEITFNGCGVGGLIATGKTIHYSGYINVNGSAILSNVNLDCGLYSGEAFLNGCTIKGYTNIQGEDCIAKNNNFDGPIYVRRDFTAEDCTLTNGSININGSISFDECSVSMNKGAIAVSKDFTATNTQITDGLSLTAKKIIFQEDSLFQADIGGIGGKDYDATVEIDRSTISINSAGNYISGIRCKNLAIDNSKITVAGIGAGISVVGNGLTDKPSNVIIKDCDSLNKIFTCTDDFTIGNNCTASIQNCKMDFKECQLESREGANIILSNTQMNFSHTGVYSGNAIKLYKINSFQSDDSCTFDFQKYQAAFDISGNPVEIKGKIQADVNSFIKSSTPVTFSGSEGKRQEIKVSANEFFNYSYGTSALATNYVDLEFVKNDKAYYHNSIDVSDTVLLKNTNASFRVSVDNSNCNIINAENVIIEDSKVLLSGNSIGIKTVSELNVNRNSVIKCYTNKALEVGSKCTMDGELQIWSGSAGDITQDYNSSYSKMLFYGNQGLFIGGDSTIRYANIDVDQASADTQTYLFRATVNNKKFNLEGSSIYGKAEISDTNNSFSGIECYEGKFDNSTINLSIKGQDAGVIGISSISDCNIRNKSHISLDFVKKGKSNLTALKGEGNLFLSEDSQVDLSSDIQSGTDQVYQVIAFNKDVTLEGNTDIKFSSNGGYVRGIQCKTLKLYRNTISANLCGGSVYLLKCDNLLMDYAKFNGKEKIAGKLEQSSNAMVDIEKQIFLDHESDFSIQDSTCTAAVIECEDSIILDGKSSLKLKDISLVSGNQYDTYVKAATGKTLLLKGGSKFLIDKINTRGEKDIQNINVINISNIYVKDNSYLGIKNAELLNNKEMYAQAEVCSTNAMHLDDTAIVEISGVEVDNQTGTSILRLYNPEGGTGMLTVSGNSQLSIQDIFSEGELKGILGKISLSENGVISILDFTGTQDVYGVDNYENTHMDGKTLWIDVKTKNADKKAYGINGKVKLTNGEVVLFAQNDGKGKAFALDTSFQYSCEIGTDSYQPRIWIGSDQKTAKLQPETYQFRKDYKGEAYLAFTKGTNSPSQPSVPEEPENPDDPEDPDDPQSEIPQKLLSSLDAKIAPIKSLDYSGYEIKPAIKLTIVENKKTKTLVEGFDYKVIYKDNIYAGSATVQVEGLREYKGTVTKTFEIKPRSIKKVKCLVEDMTLGQEGNPVVQLYDGKNPLVENVDYRVDVPENLTNTKGKKKIVITGLSAGGKGNYKDEMKASFMVYDKGILISQATISMNVPEGGYTYDGKAKKPTVQVSMSGNVLKEKKDYTISYQNNKEAGTAYVIVKGKKDYCGTSIQEFEIKAVASELTINTIKNRTYNGKQQKAGITVKSANKKLKENKDYTLVYGDCTHTGSVSVNVIGKGNFAGSKTITTYLINPLPLKKASVKLVSGQITVTYNNKILYKNVDYTVTLGEKKNGVTEVTIKAVDGGDFTGTVIKKLKL